jgi:manganese/zinc/iron transport system substrate-binding protein
MMKKYWISILLFGLLACKETNNDVGDTLYIVSTTGMINDAVINIAANRANAIALMGPGVDPHLYKATQGDLNKLTKADIIFYNGLHLEGKMAEVLQKLSRTKPVFAVAEALPPALLIQSQDFGGTYDPHIWFDVQRWSEAVKYIARVLAEKDPDFADYYHRNALNYLARLEALHQEVTENMQSIPKEKRVLITAHDAFSYFGEAYQIEVRGLQGISTVAEYGLRDITNLVDFIVARKIKAVFVETSVPEKAIKAVVEGCKKKGHPLEIGGYLYSDALGEAGTEEGTYIGMVKSNVKTIVESLTENIELTTTN